MFHGTLSVITRLRPGTTDAVRYVLRAWDERIQARQSQPFQRIEALYFAHWSLTPDGHDLIFGADLRLPCSLRGQRQVRAAVSLLVQQLADEMRRTGDRSFDALLTYCVGYPEAGLDEPARVERFLLRHAAAYSTRHIDFAYRVASVPAVRELLSLRTQVDAYLNNRQRRTFLERLDPPSLHEALRTSLAEGIGRVNTPEWERSEAAARLEAAWATLAYLPLDKPLRWLVQLQQRLTRPRETVRSLDVSDEMRARIEARQGPLQNSMVLITDVPSHWLGRLKQRLFMKLVNWRLERNTRGMNDIRAIHFARWALFQRGNQRQLLFIVTYDESWDAYIDSFVNHEDVSTFLKLIWGGSNGFPPGKPFVEPFKGWIRSAQCATLLHYSALLHGEAPAAHVAVTDLHEGLALRRVLAASDLHSPEGQAVREELGAFLEQGRFPYQDKLLSTHRAAAIVLQSLRALLRRPSSPPTARRDVHALTHELDRPRTPEAFRAPASPASGASCDTGRRPGAGASWLQTHAGRRLPAADARGRRPLPGVAARDPEGGNHDR